MVDYAMIRARDDPYDCNLVCYTCLHGELQAIQDIPRKISYMDR